MTAARGSPVVPEVNWRKTGASEEAGSGTRGSPSNASRRTDATVTMRACGSPWTRGDRRRARRVVDDAQAAVRQGHSLLNPVRRQRRVDGDRRSAGRDRSEHEPHEVQRRGGDQRASVAPPQAIPAEGAGEAQRVTCEIAPRRLLGVADEHHGVRVRRSAFEEKVDDRRGVLAHGTALQNPRQQRS